MMDLKTIKLSELHASMGANFYLTQEREKITHPIEPRPHRLPTGLIVSLTSYGKRLETLHLTLKSLAEQTVVPDKIIVWLTAEDIALMPQRCREISPAIEFARCTDVKSYKKLVPALLAYPECTIVTADDDAYYHRTWLELLVEQFSRRTVLCHIAYRYHSVGQHLAPYAEWTRDVQDAGSRRPSTDLVPIGIGGVLYPPGCLHKDVTDAGKFQDICPGADDLWFFAMARMAGTKVMKVGPRLYQVLWPKTQEVALWRENINLHNDECLMNIERLVCKIL